MRTLQLSVLPSIPLLLLAMLGCNDSRQPAPAVQPAAAATSRVQAVTGRVDIAPGKLGAYGSFEAPGSPAWELRADPELVEKYGAGNTHLLLLRCDCGKVIRMLDHRVGADGLVSPSIWHDVPECGWHVHGRLSGWEHGAWSVRVQRDKQRRNYEIPGRVALPRTQLGEFMGVEAAGSPAWELRHDPALAASLRLSNEDVLLLRCECGQVLRFGDHRVTAEGAVSPSIWHDVPECGWHVFCQLEGWEDGAWETRTLRETAAPQR